MATKKRPKTIVFKGSAASRLFSQILVAHAKPGEDPTAKLSPGTELHRMTTEEVARSNQVEAVERIEAGGSHNKFTCPGCPIH